MVAVADDLASVLFALDHGYRATAAVTSQITRTVVEWAIAKGWSPRTEARVLPIAPPGARSTVGFVDVVVRRGNGQQDLAIEIDSTDKAWSLDKLKYAAAQGMHAVWIRWGNDEWAGAYADVDVIQLWTRARPAHRSPPTEQSRLW